MIGKNLSGAGFLEGISARKEGGGLDQEMYCSG